MTHTIRLIAVLLFLASSAFDAGAVHLSDVRFKAGQPRAGQTLQDSVESEFWLRAFGETSETLKQHPDLHFELIGHAGAGECQSEGCDTLGLRRAALAYRYLLEAGVDPRQLSTLKSVGAREPIPGQPLLPELNRRVVVNVTIDPLSPPTPAPTRILSIAEVEASLGSLNGKTVSIRGLAHIALEDDHLCPSLLAGGRGKCLWLDFEHVSIDTDEEGARRSAEYSKLQDAYNRKWVVVRGVLDAGGSGHLGSAFGDLGVQAIELEASD